MFVTSGDMYTICRLVDRRVMALALPSRCVSSIRVERAKKEGVV